jgi:hypothetical protein
MFTTWRASGDVVISKQADGFFLNSYGLGLAAMNSIERFLDPECLFCPGKFFL